MQQKNPAENFFNDMQSTMKQMMDSVPTANPFDFRTIVEAQRKNMQALTEANQCVMSGWQAMAKRQAEMVSQFVQDNSEIARESITETAPQNKIAKQTEMVKAAYEQSMANAQELAEILRKSAADSADIVNRRMMSSMGEIKTTAKK